jgi:hypothetical protein
MTPLTAAGLLCGAAGIVCSIFAILSWSNRRTNAFDFYWMAATWILFAISGHILTKAPVQGSFEDLAGIYTALVAHPGIVYNVLGVLTFILACIVTYELYNPGTYHRFNPWADQNVPNPAYTALPATIPNPAYTALPATIPDPAGGGGTIPNPALLTTPTTIPNPALLTTPRTIPGTPAPESQRVPMILFSVITAIVLLFAAEGLWAGSKKVIDVMEADPWYGVTNQAKKYDKEFGPAFYPETSGRRSIVLQAKFMSAAQKQDFKNRAQVVADTANIGVDEVLSVVIEDRGEFTDKLVIFKEGPFIPLSARGPAPAAAAPPAPAPVPAPPLVPVLVKPETRFVRLRDKKNAKELEDLTLSIEGSIKAKAIFNGMDPSRALPAITIPGLNAPASMSPAPGI